MKKSKFSEAQITFILKQTEDGTSVGQVCHKAGIAEATFYNWRKEYAGLIPSEMKQLRPPEEENGKLKKIVADLSLDKEMLQDRSDPKSLHKSNFVRSSTAKGSAPDPDDPIRANPKSNPQSELRTG